jgi:hypothetical protein
VTGDGLDDELDHEPLSNYVWPRLRASRAAVRRPQVAALDAVAARSVSALDDPGAAAVASGGVPVPAARVACVQDAIRRLADDRGWPDPVAGPAAAEFDRRAAVALHREMAIVPADAAHDGVWHFVALVVLPDVARWRRPDTEVSPAGGLARHVFGRLWWRAHVFGPELVDPLPPARPLTEVELQHLLGRPALVADHAVARAVARVVVSLERPRHERESVTAALAERVLRRAPIVCFEALDDEELRREIEQLVP